MALILNLETSTSVCSVSVSRDGKNISLKEQFDAKSHASQLAPFIKEALDEVNLKPENLDAIAVSKGPGSYTGLRIGVSTAKGLAYGLKIPLISLETPFTMAFGFLENNPGLVGQTKCLLCPMIDARRMEVYTAMYHVDLSPKVNIKAEIITSESFLDMMEEYEIHFFGDGAMKCKDLISNKSALFHENFHPSSLFMGPLSQKRFEERNFENLAYFEPFYLKDFVASVPVNKVF